MTGAPIRDDEIHAFIDGELDEPRAREIAQMIAVDRVLHAKVQDFRIDKARLLEHFEPLLSRPLPAAWLARIEQARRPSPRPAWRQPLYALAASLLALVIGWSGYQAMLARSGDAVIDEAIAARDVSVDPAVPFDAAKMSAVLGLRVKVPDLTRAGYALAGAAVVPKSGSKAVKLDYRGRDNHTFTLYLKPSPGEARFEMSARGAVRICLWQDDVLSTVMVGEMSAAEMLRVASLAYNGLYF